MIIENQKMIKSITNKVIRFATKNYKNNDIDVFMDFIRLYFTQASSEDLVGRSTDDLYGLVFNHWHLMLSKPAQGGCINIYNPTVANDGWHSTHTIIQISIEDRPFLVDSIRMEIDRMGINNYLMIYMGGMTVQRQSVNDIISVAPYKKNIEDKAARVEAPIHVEIGHQTDLSVIDELKSNLERVMRDVTMSVGDWSVMRDQMLDLIDEVEENKARLETSLVSESIAYMRWLLKDHFTFLGMRDYIVSGSGDKLALTLVSNSGLGVLSDESASTKIRYFKALPDGVQSLMLSNKHILIISKTNTRSTVHRAGYTDYIGVKRFNSRGELVGERRFIGLYTSTAYQVSPYEVPVLRKKVEMVLQKSGFPLRSHAGKDLAHILTNLPRDDLFQASVQDLLNLSLGILHLQERRLIRLFVRKDVYRRFMSCLVYIPRDKFTTGLIRKMQSILVEAFQGSESIFSTHFSSSVLAQIHFVIRLGRGRDVIFNHKAIENKLIAAGESWDDGLAKSIVNYYKEERGNLLVKKYSQAFSAGYRENFSPAIAVNDISFIENLTDKEKSLGMNAYRTSSSRSDVICMKLYRWHETVPLSDALPMLENMGLRVIEENPYSLTFEDGQQVWINDFRMICKEGCGEYFDAVKDMFQDMFYQIWMGAAESDILNSLTLYSKLDWRQISVLRAYAKYIKQTGVMFSKSYIYDALLNNADIASWLMDYFQVKFDPEIKSTSREKELINIENRILAALDHVKALDEDRILRHYLAVITATTRTNYFLSAGSGYANYFSFKFDSSLIPGLPKPKPVVEIFVYSTSFEGIHLRFGKVARGGLRWSDRPEDFRTEVLGLCQAQHVKNALIVPAGAKGGFVPKNIPLDADRDTVMKLGVECYMDFINGLIDCVDNFENEKIVRPANIVAYDGDDPYLVVAADKGTATFSDIANTIALSRGFWLGDAFASGGSTGYDHKKIGITARGAWVSAQRHCLEQRINLDTFEISVIGIGDMSGDVFGNGMLMSPYIKLIAAFNHRSIFIDPNPSNLNDSFVERMRLFNLPRSDWSDYDPNLLSKGGGVYSRKDKLIRISDEARELLRADSNEYVPNDLIRVILQAPVDMMWNGGIGTFIKSTQEEHSHVGDRTNDVIRINATDCRAKMICEGGNLGLTRKARVEYALRGGRINTDFIDNSAGVDCSDHEVNMKILLNAVLTTGAMSIKQRNQLLRKLTDEVAISVLQNNYQQNRNIAQTVYESIDKIDLYKSYVSHQEECKRLNRKIECIPDDKTLLLRKAEKLGLTRPEVSTLIANSKNIIENKLRFSSIPDDPYYAKYIKEAFPLSMHRRFKLEIENHQLRREIISTQLSNQIVSDMGFAFLYQMEQELQVNIAVVFNAYSVIREVFSLNDLFAEVQSYDHAIDPIFQYKMTGQIISLIRRSTRWLIRHATNHSDIESMIAYYKPHINGLFKRVPKLLVGSDREAYHSLRDELIEAGVNDIFAKKIASMRAMFHSLIVIDSASKASSDIARVSRFYFNLIQRFDLIWFRDIMDSYHVNNHWVALAKSGYKTDLDNIQSDIVVAVVLANSKTKTISAKIDEWMVKNQKFVINWSKILNQLRSDSTVDFAIITVAMKCLSNLALSQQEG